MADALEWWDALSDAWKKVLLVNESFAAHADPPTINGFMNPDNDNLVAWHNAVLRRKFAVPKSVTEATKKRILELPFLACYSSKLVSLDPLARLQSLERVNARKNRELVAIEALSELEKLREVSVVLTAVADLRPLSKCR